MRVGQRRGKSWNWEVGTVRGRWALGLRDVGGTSGDFLTQNEAGGAAGLPSPSAGDGSHLHAVGTWRLGGNLQLGLLAGHCPVGWGP